MEKLFYDLASEYNLKYVTYINSFVDKTRTVLLSYNPFSSKIYLLVNPVNKIGHKPADYNDFIELEVPFIIGKLRAFKTLMSIIKRCKEEEYRELVLDYIELWFKDELNRLIK